MPATSVRDLIIKDDDIAVATHGRGFWILDNITPLRQLRESASEETLLFKPQTALRVRWNLNTDTPLPPDEPAGENPPEGAMIDYSVGGERERPGHAGDQRQQRQRRAALCQHRSGAPPDPKLKIPRYWVKPPQPLSAQPGLHRFFWDLHAEPLKNNEADYPMTAILQKTAPQPTGPWVVPGEYSVVLTAGRKSFTQSLSVKMDPRVKTSAADLAKQFELSKALYDARVMLEPIGKSFDALAAELAKAKEKAGEQPIKDKIDALNKKLQEFVDPARVRAGQTLELEVLSKVRSLFGELQDVDARPTSQAEAAARDLQSEAKSVAERWRALTQEVASLNAALEAAGLEKLKFP